MKTTYFATWEATIESSREIRTWKFNGDFTFGEPITSSQQIIDELKIKYPKHKQPFITSISKL